MVPYGGGITSAATPSVWQTWASGTSATCATWSVWAGATTTSTNTSTYAIATQQGIASNIVWTSWINTASTTGVCDRVWRVWGATTQATVRVVESPEQRAQREAAEREERRITAARRETQAKEQEKANRRAKALLVSMLNDSQRRTLEERGYFDEEVPGHGTFRIYKGWAGNVRRLDAQGREVEKYCIHPTERMPDFDNMAVQRLMLQADPAGFLRTANRTVLA